MKRTPLKRTAMKRRTVAMRARNPKRLQKRYQEAYGEHADFVRSFRCAVPDCLWTMLQGCVVEAAHVKSRGAGGKACDLAPLCSIHHRESHTVGFRTFEKRYDLDLRAYAAALWATSKESLTVGEG